MPWYCPAFMIIAHISDIHLRPEGDLAHDVADTAAGLVAAVERLAALDPPAGAVLITGDLVDFPNAEAYAQLRRLLDPLPAPVYPIPGNCDDRASLRAAFADAGCLPEDGVFLHYAVEDLPVRLLALDTVKEGAKTGEMCKERLSWLKDRLAEAPGRPTVILMHHPPFRTGVPFMDSQGFAGADAFAEIVGAHENVERVLCGHLHRPVQRRFAGTLACVAPSTAFHMPLDLRPDAALGLVLEPAAGFLHVWGPGFGMVTHTLPLVEHPGPYPFRRRPAQDSEPGARHAGLDNPSQR